MTRSEDGALGCLAIIVGAAVALFVLNVLGM
jgi:hypothetical protein